jgi:GxxExxY protein
MDLLVEDKVVIELKTVDFLTDVHKAQLLTYLKLGNYKLGLLINFNETLLKNKKQFSYVQNTKMETNG